MPRPPTCTLADWTRSTRMAQAENPIALDGTPIRGARIDEHVCSPFACIRARKRSSRSQCLRRPMRSPEHRPSSPACRWPDGCVPPLHTQKDFMQCIDAFGGTRVLTVTHSAHTVCGSCDLCCRSPCFPHPRCDARSPSKDAASASVPIGTPPSKMGRWVSTLLH